MRWRLALTDTDINKSNTADVEEYEMKPLTPPAPAPAPDPTPVFDVAQAEADLHEASASGLVDGPDAVYNWAALKAMRTAEALLAEVKRLTAPDLVQVPRAALAALWQHYRTWAYEVGAYDPTDEQFSRGYVSLYDAEDMLKMEDACDLIQVWEALLERLLCDEEAGDADVA